MKHVYLITLLITMASIALPVSAAPIDDAWTAYDSGNYNKAAELFRKIQTPPPKALGAICSMAVLKRSVSTPDADLKSCKDGLAQNDPAAYMAMGLAHLYGNDWLKLDKDEKIGLGYLGNSVTLGYEVADDYLCSYYYETSSFAKASPFCKVSASAGLPDGLYHLALMSIQGNGVVQDFKRGRQFALLSASMNNARAFMLLGDMSANKKYGKPKVEGAYAWYSLATAAAPDWTDPKTARDQLNLNPTQIEEAQKIAEAWKSTSSPKWRDLY